MLAFALAIPMLLAQTVVLDNGVIRVEVEPRLFHLCFVGFSGGVNFLDPMVLDRETIEGKGWADPGGLITDVWPAKERDPALRRGPATIESQTRLALVLLGPVSETLGVRMKKELRLDPAAPKATCTLSLLSNSQTPRQLGLRSMARLPLRSTVRLPHGVELRPLTGAAWDALPAALQEECWTIPVPPTHRVSKTLLGADSDACTVENRSGAWTRTRRDRAPGGSESDGNPPFLCVLDDDTRSYGAALQCAPRNVSLGEPLVFAEEWTFERAPEAGTGHATATASEHAPAPHH